MDWKTVAFSAEEPGGYLRYSIERTWIGVMLDLRHFKDFRLSHRGSWCGAVLMAGLVLTALPSGAHAQINPFRGYRGPTLTKEDFASGRMAAAKLLNEDQAEIGKTEDWTGPASGNKGSISVQRAFRRRGMECRTLRSEVHYSKRSVPSRTLNLDVCRLRNGEWKLI